MNSLGSKECKRCGCNKPLTEFHKHRGRPDGLQSYCKNCSRSSTMASYHKLDDEDKKNRSRGQKLKERYGISLDTLHTMWQTAGGRCEICKAPMEMKERGYAVDHNHADGTVRGLLCMSCNQGLGRFKDDPTRLRAAALYIEAYQKAD